MEKCTSMGRVFLGVVGWEWADWERGFYPEDMPTDWRLTYYNTQFNCVFVPSSHWSALPETEFKQWAEDTHDQFLFLLEGGAGASVPAPLQGRARIVHRSDPDLYWFDQNTELRKLSETLKTRASQTAYVISQDGEMGQIERVRTLMGLLGLLA